MISADELSEAIFGELKTFSEEVDEALKDEVDKVTKEAKKSLDNNSVIPVRTGAYRRGFRIKKVADGMGYRRNRICNKEYRLTHLLEKGHATRNGSRTKAYPHWKHAQEIVDTLPERLIRRLGKK